MSGVKQHFSLLCLDEAILSASFSMPFFVDSSRAELVVNFFESSLLLEHESMGRIG